MSPWPSFAELLVNRPPIVVCCRKSPEKPRRAALAKLELQKRNLLALAADHGLHVIGVHAVIWSGRDPEWLREPADLARPHGGVLLAEYRSRYMKPIQFYETKDEQAPLTKRDLRQLLDVTGDVPLYVVHEDAARSHQTKRGLPGYKKQLRQKLIQHAHRLRGQGHSLRQIGQKLGVSASTLSDWLKRSI